MTSKTPKVFTDIIYDIYDAENDEKMVVRETIDLPGLIDLQWDFSKMDPSEFSRVCFTVEQAEHVASALLATAKLIKARELDAKTKDAL